MIVTTPTQEEIANVHKLSGMEHMLKLFALMFPSGPVPQNITLRLMEPSQGGPIEHVLEWEKGQFIVDTTCTITSVFLQDEYGRKVPVAMNSSAMFSGSSVTMGATFTPPMADRDLVSAVERALGHNAIKLADMVLAVKEDRVFVVKDREGEEGWQDLRTVIATLQEHLAFYEGLKKDEHD